MVKRNKDVEVDILIEDWTSVNRKDDEMAWLAWRDWRMTELGCNIEPENFTVPTMFPPATVAAAKEYVSIIGMIRKSIKWNNSAARLPTDVSAYMGPRS